MPKKTPTAPPDGHAPPLWARKRPRTNLTLAPDTIKHLQQIALDTGVPASRTIDQWSREERKREAIRDPKMYKYTLRIYHESGTHYDIDGGNNRRVATQKASKISDDAKVYVEVFGLADVALYHYGSIYKKDTTT